MAKLRGVTGMDLEPKRRMDGMAPRVGMDGMGRRPVPVQTRPVPAPAPQPVPAPPPIPAPPKRKFGRKSAQPAAPTAAPVPKPAPVAPKAVPAAKATPTSRPVEAPAGRQAAPIKPQRRWLRRTLQGIAWLAIILAVASALVELYVRYYQ